MIDRAQKMDSIDRRLTAWMARHGVLLLRLSLGVIFLWFGALKFFPGLSPAQDLAARTMDALTFGLVPTRAAILILAAWECVIGIGLLAGKMLRLTLLLLWLQMLGTVTPAFLFPAEVFVRFPYALTLEGQYIVKNLVLVTAGLVIGATVRGGRLTPEAAGSQGGVTA
jgi:uncharacterized membrane protein YphA (DoxX/SURF4 family)